MRHKCFYSVIAAALVGFALLIMSPVVNSKVIGVIGAFVVVVALCAGVTIVLIVFRHSRGKCVTFHSLDRRDFDGKSVTKDRVP
jgi:hypothetical protein